MLAGVVLGAERTWRRRQEYLNRAAYHATLEAKLSAQAKALAAELAGFPPALLNGSCLRVHPETLKSVMTNRATRAAQHGRLKERYLQAARCPWEPGPELLSPVPGFTEEWDAVRTVAFVVKERWKVVEAAFRMFDAPRR
jgi:hypothetical protein